MRQHFRHAALGDAPCQAFGNSGFAHACLTHQQGVVFAAAAQYLDDALHFQIAPDKRVDFALFGYGVEVVGVLLQGRGFFGAFATLGTLAAFFAAFARGAFVSASSSIVAIARFFDAVRHVIDHIQSGYALLVQVVHGVRVFFAKDGNQHIGTSDFFFAAGGRLHVHDGALNHALKA